MLKIFKASLNMGFLVISIMIFQSCAARGPVFQKIETIPENISLVYIYRPEKFIGALVSYDIKAGDEYVVNLQNGGYFPYITKPRPVEFWAETEAKSSVSLVIKPGREYYIRGTVVAGIFIGRPKLEVVSPENAKQEILKCKLLSKNENLTKEDSLEK